MTKPSTDDCRNPQCKQVHNLLDATARLLGVDLEGAPYTVNKSARIAMRVSETQKEMETLRAQVKAMEPECVLAALRRGDFVSYPTDFQVAEYSNVRVEDD